MSYVRVIPRDLFNEANLLKCYGQLWLLLDTVAPKGVELEYTGNTFNIEQNQDDGSLSITNIVLTIRSKRYRLFRPLNSREPWPLYAQEGDYAEWEVFTDTGGLSKDFFELLKG